MIREAINKLADPAEDERPYNSMPLSSSGLSAGADDPLAGILDLGNTLDSVGAGALGDTKPSFDGLITLDS